jgi:hypothetical protein
MEYEDWDTFLADVERVEVDWGEVYYDEEARELVKAIKADGDAGDFLRNVYYDDSIYIQIFVDDEYRTFHINEHFSNAMQWLDEHGYLQNEW